MKQDEQINAITETITQTVPVLYRWILRPDPSGLKLYSPLIAVMKVVRMQGPLPMSSIAQELSYSKQNLTHIVDQLEKEGYVERTTDPSDRRVLKIALTAQGKRYMAERKKLIMNRLAEDLSHLSDEELEHLHGLFEEVKEALPRIMQQDRPG